eukprot:11157751-Lingulodinium_polyedra.AAC.1
MWLVSIRPDINYATKGLGRSVKQPTQQDMQKLRHLFRYMRGPFSYTYDLAPKLAVTDDATTDVVIYVDSDWA